MWQAVVVATLLHCATAGGFFDPGELAAAVQARLHNHNTDRTGFGGTE